jgi:hypothetical protein
VHRAERKVGAQDLRGLAVRHLDVDVRAPLVGGGVAEEAISRRARQQDGPPRVVVA